MSFRTFDDAAKIQVVIPSCILILLLDIVLYFSCEHIVNDWIVVLNEDAHATAGNQDRDPEPHELLIILVDQ